MKRNLWLFYAACLLLGIACQIASPTPTSTVSAPPTETLAPTATPLPTDTPTLEPTPSPTGTPTPTPEPLLSDEIYRSPEGGYSIPLPIAWKLIEEDEEAYLAGPDERSATGPRIGMIGNPLDAPTTLEDFLNSTLEQFKGSFPESGSYTVSEPTELTLGGVPALGIQFTGPFAGPDEGEITIYVTVALPNDHQSFLIVAFATTERWNDDVAPVYNALRETITFYDLNEE